jgi:hypothetical protein
MNALAIVAVVAAIGLLSTACFGPAQGFELSVQETPQTDRTNCEELYGTAFRSEAEREFFHSNCSDWSATVESATSIATPSSSSGMAVEPPPTNSGRTAFEPGTANVPPASIPTPTPIILQETAAPPSRPQQTGSGSGAGSSQPVTDGGQVSNSPQSVPQQGGTSPTATQPPSPVLEQPRQNTTGLCERGYRNAAERKEHLRTCR